ncbi:hypothetical protein CNYM01_01581 [Colletotrichum nymphaeae SA-01]|uniref:Uncharacterized protein n=1 Tax=Colletotrichum nymphaeae SA-01 TaxID=1460502 RepID=A0A135UIT6_9PEZI|nr:hypothetical protein CNYM01_01581 [Colletotrichum nymphaeae SA-01]
MSRLASRVLQRPNARETSPMIPTLERPHPPSSMQRALLLPEHQPQVRRDHSSQNTRETARRGADCTLLSILPTGTKSLSVPKKSCPPFPHIPKYPHKLPIAPQRIPIPVNMPPSRHPTHSGAYALLYVLPPSLIQPIHLSAVGA